MLAVTRSPSFFKQFALLLAAGGRKCALVHPSVRERKRIMNKKHDLSLPWISEGLHWMVSAHKLYASVTSDEYNLQQTGILPYFPAHFQWNKTSSKRETGCTLPLDMTLGITPSCLKKVNYDRILHIIPYIPKREGSSMSYGKCHVKLSYTCKKHGNDSRAVGATWKNLVVLTTKTQQALLYPIRCLKGIQCKLQSGDFST